MRSENLPAGEDPVSIWNMGLEKLPLPESCGDYRFTLAGPCGP
jgi:hypothetical protein